MTSGGGVAEYMHYVGNKNDKLQVENRTILLNLFNFHFNHGDLLYGDQNMLRKCKVRFFFLQILQLVYCKKIGNIKLSLYLRNVFWLTI